MDNNSSNLVKDVNNIYQAVAEWDINIGGVSIVAKRMAGRFRRLKWLGMSVWLVFFLGPYLRWDNRQAVLFDIPNRQFHFFDITVFPQDIWMLALTLLFFAILLAVVTSIAGRVFCGYFCFQTIWTDIYTFIEARLEGNTPQQALKFANAPWSFNKICRLSLKHTLWMLIAILTGISFTIWFADAFELWHAYLTLQAPLPAWITVLVFTCFTYGFAGFMREQVCFWLCPYARLQGVMYDQDTLLPAYDAERGEPRGRLRKNQTHSTKGSCIDCNMCVAVCPTGIDIRKGQQEGCITCGLCIDACDSIMTKIDQATGLIRYASYKDLHHNGQVIPAYKRPRVMIYSTILMLTLVGVIYGFISLSATEFKVIHQRQPLFVKLSDGSIQNKYTIKVLNKTKDKLKLQFNIAGIEGATLHNLPEIVVEPGKVIPINALVRVPEYAIRSELTPLIFNGVAKDSDIAMSYQTIFIAPKVE